MGILLVAKLIGHIVSCFPAAEFGEQLNRQVEIDKSTTLKEAKGNFDAQTELNLTSNGGYPMHNFLKML